MISNHATDVERCETFQIIVENSAPISCSVGANVLEALERAGHKGDPCRLPAGWVRDLQGENYCG